MKQRGTHLNWLTSYFVHMFSHIYFTFISHVSRNLVFWSMRTLLLPSLCDSFALGLPEAEDLLSGSCESFRLGLPEALLEMNLVKGVHSTDIHLGETSNTFRVSTSS